jgi:lactoylglutathione lyase
LPHSDPRRGLPPLTLGERREDDPPGPGPCIHHWGIEVEDRDAYIAKIKASGGTIISHPDEGALKFRAPDGTVAEIVGIGRYKKKSEKE